MQALSLFNQNFSVTEYLLQLYQLFHGMKKVDLKEDLRLAVCACLETPENTAFQPAANDRALLLAKSAVPMPQSLTMDGGLDFLLRQAVVVACTCLESFFWDALRENVLTIVKARKSGADKTLRNITFTLGDYISLQQWDDPDERLKQIILNNFKRGTLYSVERIEEITKIMTVTKFWERIEQSAGIPAKDIKRLVGDLITRRNQVAHRADRPDEGEDPDTLGLRPITLAWTNQRVQTAKTLVAAAAELMAETINHLKADIKAAEEQNESQAAKILKQISDEVERE